ncbi:MAG TPA: DNA-3-methyladenine glycosylase I [Mycobacteriales bacterium]|nr:DNA-3-methyladenine glycosylase I [Mycobacteriales bacterium]
MRCFGEGDELYARYHDEEWGRPVRTQQGLFERICLEGFQAGLAWITVLRKREALREVLHGFDPVAVAAMDVTPLLEDARLIRSRAKLAACVTNARATLALEDDLVDLVWQHRSDGPAPTSWSDVPGSTPASVALAKDLKRRGFVFVGPTTAYAMLQACGVVNDHLAACPVRDDVEAARASLS